MRETGKVRAVLATMRVANVPSVLGNVWLGAALMLAAGGAGGGDLRWAWPVLWAGLAGVALYVAGNFLNDWMDREWDRTRRPERALPRGMFAPRSYLAVALGGIATGLGVAGVAGPGVLAAAVGIVVGVVVYTWWHKRGSWTVLVMGLCRAGLPVMGAAGAAGAVPLTGAWWLVGGAAGVLWCYIAGLSLVARGARSGSQRLAAWILLGAVPVALVPWIMARLGVGQPLGLTGLGVYGLWLWISLGLAGEGGCRVSRLLAGIPLVDWLFLLPLGLAGWPHGMSEPLWTWGCLWVPPLLAGLALWLQRVAPAT